MSEPAKNPLKLFYCYAHEDKALCDTLDIHLSALKRQNLIDIWYDKKIGPGKIWEDEIKKHLTTADIVLLLISAAFLASDYCYGKEMERALQRHKDGTALVIPIILRPVDWEDTPFSNLQVLPARAVPVTRWITPDDACEDIAKSLRVVVKDLHLSQKTANKNSSVYPPYQPPQEPAGYPPPFYRQPIYQPPQEQPIYPQQPSGQLLYQQQTYRQPDYQQQPSGQPVSQQPPKRELGFSWTMIVLFGVIAALIEGVISQGSVIIGLIIPIIAGFVTSRFTSSKWTGTIAGFIPMIVLGAVIESIDYPHVVLGIALLTTIFIALIGMLLGFIGGWLATTLWRAPR